MERDSLQRERDEAVWRAQLCIDSYQRYFVVGIDACQMADRLFHVGYEIAYWCRHYETIVPEGKRFPCYQASQAQSRSQS